SVMMTRRSILAVSMAVLAFGCERAAAAPKPFAPRLENFDRRAPAPTGPGRTRRARNDAIENLQRQVPDLELEFDPFTDAPSFVRSRTGLLSVPQGAEGGAPAAARAGLGDSHAATKAFLNEHRDLFGHGAEALAAARVQREFVTAHNGAKTV